MNRDRLVPVDVVVTLWLKPEADMEEVLCEMDYSFTHGDDIVDTEIADIRTHPCGDA